MGADALRGNYREPAGVFSGPKDFSGIFRMRLFLSGGSSSSYFPL